VVLQGVPVPYFFREMGRKMGHEMGRGKFHGAIAGILMEVADSVV
jgi:hypothetical protein